MVKTDRENQGHYEQQHQYTIVIRTDDQQEKEADEEDHELGYDDVREDCTNKKAILTLEERHALRAVMPDVKRVRGNLRFATGRTTKSQTATEYSLNLFRICFQRMYHLTPGHKEAQK